MQNRLPELLPSHAGIDTDIVIEPTLAGAASQLLRRIGFTDKQLAIVCDDNTYAALGVRLTEELASLETILLKLHGHVHADEKTLHAIASHPADAYIAVGSGVISDLCKYVSHQAGKPYAVFPTAPSMNGYLSANASITLHGIKESRPAHLPAGVFCDMQAIAASPHRLIKSGLGDSLCRSTAQADWLLSHLLLDSAYSDVPFKLLAPYEAELFAHADKLLVGDIKAIELLMRALLISGIGMTIAGGSYPASQGEHMIAHTMEMKHGESLPETYHGEQIAVTTLTMAKIQHELLARKLELPKEPNWQEALALYFGRKQAQYISPGPEKKYKLYERYDALAERLARHESEIREQLRHVMLPETTLQAVLQKAGAPMTSEELGWSYSEYEAGVRHARFTRNRFTFLDLLAYEY